MKIIFPVFYLKLIYVCFFSTLNVYGHNLTVGVKNINVGDSIQIILQQSAQTQKSKWVKYDSLDEISYMNFDLHEGKWALIIDATGYTYPSAKEINIPEDSSALVTLTPMLNQDYFYEWSDDDSYAGHATHTYINEPYELTIIDQNIQVPNDFSSINLRNDFGIVLSNDGKFWNQEDAFKLYTTINQIPVFDKIDINSDINYENGENINLILKLTDDYIFRDIEIESSENGIITAIISHSAFTYASPLVGILDGIKTRFYSKRLFNAMVYYITDYGSDDIKINDLAKIKYGVEFMVSDQRTENLMNETKSNFQEFYFDEKLEILSMFEELPEGTHKLNNLRYLVRRIDGQDNPKVPSASGIAWGWGENGTIEFMSKGFNGTNLSDTRRLILHEKAHFIYWDLVDEDTKNEWIELGGWFLDPTSPSGWSTWKTTEFLTAYGHANGPGEDFAECFSYYVENVDKLKTVSMGKYEFMRDRVMHGTRYEAQIREDLTFQVYNLWPDYMYPGKIKSVKLEVEGGPEEDKIIKVELKLHSSNFPDDGSTGGGFSIYSTIGTVQGIGLSPKNGNIDSVLVGQVTLSKYVKNGYWKPGTIQIRDKVGNTRYENTSTIGFKLWIENPLEDIDPPIFNNDFNIEVINERFDPTIGNWDNWEGDDSGDTVQALRITGTAYDALPLQYFNASVFYPDLDHEFAQLYDFGVFDEPHIDEDNNIKNEKNSIKHYDIIFPIMEWSPSGWYSVSMVRTEDLAKNGSFLYLVNDLEAFDDSPEHIFEDLRDSLYIETDYPDYIAPEINLNNIKINAEPVNPNSPDGETRFDISFFVRDLSDYPGFESGAKQVWYTLRNPLGYEFSFNSEGQSPELEKNRTTYLPHGNSDWQFVELNTLLPKGSAPGKWGVTGMEVIDRNRNTRKYSFLEYVRFDVIKSDIVLTSSLYAEITDKVVNASNVDSISAFITCAPCANLKYNYTIYSQMGGIVKTGEKIMGSDSVYVTDLDVSGIPDGIITLTVQLKDSLDQLVATTSTDYTKDVILPSAYYLQTNLQDLGTSNLDSLVVDVVTNELNGEYELTLTGDSIVDGNSIIPGEDINDNLFNSTQETVKATRVIRGKVTDIMQSIPIVDLNNFADGLILLELVITDSAFNVGTEIYSDTVFKITNSPPISISSTDSLSEDSQAFITLISEDIDGDTLTYIITDSVKHGTLFETDEPNIFLYTPDTNFYGIDSLRFKVADKTTESDTSQNKIIVISVNDAPVTSTLVVTTNEDTPLDIDIVATDVDGDALIYVITTNPTNGTLTMTGSVVTYTPNVHYNGSDSFSYRVNDGTLNSNATVPITVNPVNDPPVSSDKTETTNEDISLPIDITATDVEGDGSINYTIVSLPSNGNAIVVGNVATYTPNANYNGTDSFTYKANDGTDDGNTATVSITITAIDDVSVAQPQSITTNEDTLKSFNLLATEVDGDALMYSIASTPANGTVTLSGATATYTPDLDYNGSDSFQFSVNDGTTTTIATVSITVTPVDDISVAEDQVVSTKEDTPVGINLDATNVDGDVLTYSILTNPTNGTLILVGSTVTYTPNANYHGPDSFTWSVNDGTTTTDATVTITVTSVYDLPEISISTEMTSAEEVESTLPLSIKIEGVDAGDEYVTFDLVLSGTASDSDYTISSKSVVMDTGVVEATANIVIVDDTEYEEEETLVIGVENVQNALDTVQSVTITILRNDVPLGETSPRIVSRVYPNPAESYFVIEFNEIFKIQEINMLDPSGRVYAPTIKESSYKKLIIDVSKLSKGVHIIRLKTDIGSASFKLIID